MQNPKVLLEGKDAVDALLIKVIKKHYGFDVKNVESGTHDAKKYNIKPTYSYPFRR